VPGSRLYLPVEVPGALFSVGDTHAAQGDGEVCGTAIETALKAHLRFGLLKQTHQRLPRFETPGETAPDGGKGYWVTTGIGPDLMQGARDATREMIDLLMKEHGLDAPKAYMLCSVAGHLRISEVVDAPNWVVSMYIPKAIFG
ncbi:MAG TPA: acetamidase/formamidase family protein, partial [Limnochordales bacterium]